MAAEFPLRPRALDPQEQELEERIARESSLSPDRTDKCPGRGRDSCGDTVVRTPVLPGDREKGAK